MDKFFKDAFENAVEEEARSMHLEWTPVLRCGSAMKSCVTLVTSGLLVIFAACAPRSANDPVSQRDGCLLLFEVGPSSDCEMRVLCYSLRDGHMREIVREEKREGRSCYRFSFCPPDRLCWVRHEGREFRQVMFTPTRGVQEYSVDPHSGGLGSLSPDGCWSAFMGHVQELRIAATDGNWEEVDGSSWFRFPAGILCVSKVDTNKVQEFPNLRITGLGCDSGTGAWSLDAKRVLFSAFRDPQWYRGEFLGSIHLRDRADFARRLPQFLYACDVKDGSAKQLCEGQEGRWSPDGAQVAVLRDGRILSIVDAEGKAEPKGLLTERWRIPDFCWSPDGKEICYLGLPERTAEAEAQARMFGVDWDRGIRMTTADGSKKEYLFSGYFKRVFWVSAFGETTVPAPGTETTGKS